MDDKENMPSSGPSTVEKSSPPPSSGPEDTPSGRKYRGWKWFCVCAAAYSSAFLYGLDTTIVADIQPFAVEQFGGVERLGWLGIGFPLGSVATILSFGKAFGMFDVKW